MRYPMSTHFIAGITVMAAGLLPTAVAQADSMEGTSNNNASSSMTLKEYGTQLKTACNSDVAKLCNDVTPGQGRVAACLNSKEDQLSPDCHANWVGVKSEVSKKMDKADIAFRRDCGSDVQKFCANVPSGKSRLLNCLDQHQTELSNSCQSFQAKLNLRMSRFLG